MMTKDELFELYKEVQNKNRFAEERLILEHSIKYPRNPINKLKRGECAEYRRNLHTMYLHLTR